VAHTIRAALPILVAQGHGHVVITASISGRTTYVQVRSLPSRHRVTGGREIRRHNHARPRQLNSSSDGPESFG
jgi:NAD(P)-dependent dehydrogenase (short-subunit alcohol dehydrogenase family)